MYNHICTYYYHNMTLTAHMIGTYLIIDANTIHKKRPSTICTRSFLYQILHYGKAYGCLSSP